MRLEELKSGLRIGGLMPAEVVTVIFAQGHGSDAVELTYKTTSGDLGQRIVFRKDENELSIATSGSRAFDASAADFKLVAEAQRITLAGLFDPMIAVATSDVQPLPHQIRAVYGELLPRTPLRFLLADDPGAGKTIMAGLYIKELILRDDVKRCLIVAPGGLVDQWQDELFFKFGLNFNQLTNELVESNVNLNVFDAQPFLIARMDQLSRNENLKVQLKESEWDLVVVDEAHRMGAHFFGGKLEKTKRFQLGEMLGEVSRHLLLMTATPHSGKEEDFQLFLTLLDRDRYEGRIKTTADTSGVMRRMVKEDLLTFEGKKLFPERIAVTVPYVLTSLEYDLYEQVTDYVREGMNRADRVGGQRKHTVGFALTVLQRRLASSPEAIYRSLVRRSERLERKRQETVKGTYKERGVTFEPADLDSDSYNAEEIEELEEELVDAATSSETVHELNAELTELAGLTKMAKRVRDSGTDRKWTELSTILLDVILATSRDEAPRKLIIFTEHRDTLEYLRWRVGALVGGPNAVLAIHGGVRRHDRRQITAEFTQNRDCQILLATDAAGEGLNLQAAHLMVNYDLPWNPNRIEQRFGRIHRIGQTDVCRLWNLVASNTREGAVFTTLLNKIDQQRKAYGGRVFDVLGEVFIETPLRDLLIEAIQYGERDDVRARIHEVIDRSVGDGLKELLDERALASEHLSDSELEPIRTAMDEARARRLQPHYVEVAFKAAFARFRGHLIRREPGRYEIASVPAQIRSSKHGPIVSKYNRVTFDLLRVQPDGLARADLLAPGHPVHDAVMDETIRRFGGTLNSGTILVSSSAVDEPRLLVGVIEKVADATGNSVARRFGYAFVDSSGKVTPAGPAPYLDYAAAPEGSTTLAARQLSWLAEAEDKATSWIIANQLPEYLAEIRPRRTAELARTRHLVTSRLTAERDRLLLDAGAAAQKERSGQKPKESSEGLRRKAVELDDRLRQRLELLDQQASMSTLPPLILTAALVLPLWMVRREMDADAPIQATAAAEVERRGIELVLMRERQLGRRPVEQRLDVGFDILSTTVDGAACRIEVKARLVGAENFFIAHNEVMTGKNAAPAYRLALVLVDSRGPQHDDVRYLDNVPTASDLDDYEAGGITGSWERSWARGRRPY